MGFVAGVDLGATNLRVAVADDQGEVVDRGKRETPQEPDGTAIEGAIRELLRSVCTDAGLEPTDLSAVGVAAAGVLDLGAGVVEEPANLPGVDQIRLREPLAEETDGGPVFVLNDATAGVVGERFTADTAPDDLVYLTISSGIGAGVCVDGHVLSGWNGNVGEVGHTVVDPAGRRDCGCGREGHWEAYCSGDNIPDYTRDLRADEFDDTALPLEDPGFAAADVFAHAGEDPLADHVVDRLARWNAIGVANLVHAYAPEVVAIGGAVALRNQRDVVEPIRERIEPLVATNVPEVREPTRGEDVILFGAVASATAGVVGER